MGSRWPDTVPAVLMTAKRLPWQAHAAGTAIVGLVVGLGLSAVPTIYDLTHWDTLWTVARGKDQSMNVPAAEMLGRLIDDAGLAIIAIAAVALVASAALMMSGSRAGYVAAVITVAPWVLCCGYASVPAGGSDSCESDPNCLGPVYPPGTAAWIAHFQATFILWSLTFAVATLCFLLCSPTRRAFGRPTG
jgi:hypothetical protein